MHHHHQREVCSKASSTGGSRAAHARRSSATPVQSSRGQKCSTVSAKPCPAGSRATTWHTCTQPGVHHTHASGRRAQQRHGLHPCPPPTPQQPVLCSPPRTPVWRCMSLIRVHGKTPHLVQLVARVHLDAPHRVPGQLRHKLQASTKGAPLDEGRGRQRSALLCDGVSASSVSRPSREKACATCRSRAAGGGQRRRGAREVFGEGEGRRKSASLSQRGLWQAARGGLRQWRRRRRRHEGGRGRVRWGDPLTAQSPTTCQRLDATQKPWGGRPRTLAREAGSRGVTSQVRSAGRLLLAGPSLTSPSGDAPAASPRPPPT